MAPPSSSPTTTTTPASNTTVVQRFVPQGDLSSDAPGWHASVVATAAPSGPTCWKCKGLGHVVCRRNNKRARRKRKRQGQDEENEQEKEDAEKDKDDCNDKTQQDHQQEQRRCCPVCHGKGFLAPKQRDAVVRSSSSSSVAGMITRRRQRPSTWHDFGPVAFALQQLEERRGAATTTFTSSNVANDKDAWHYLALAQVEARKKGEEKEPSLETTDTAAGIFVPLSLSHDTTNDVAPPWLPTQPGEELCNLVGNWRILQRVASHRWTTDDLVTAHVASLQQLPPNKKVRYLDLGCGNGSVLLMVLWSLLHKGVEIEAAHGVEAREEAVQLARRSLAFNLGVHTDERDETAAAAETKRQRTETSGEEEKEEAKKRVPVQVVHADFRQLAGAPSSSASKDDPLDQIRNNRFDLITGTPPYFRVDFVTEPAQDRVESAVIRQGGMPTSVQSAPARCEFRGGVEAYCQAAAALLGMAGKFIVCENWLNHDRVLQAARECRLHVQSIHPVRGKVGRPQHLFAVYVMTCTGTATTPVMHPPLYVRAPQTGKWTREYADVLESFSIPARHWAEAE